MDASTVRKQATLYSNPFLQVQVCSGSLADGTAVALKEQMHPTLAAANRGISEALLQAQLVHPNICRFYGCWVENCNEEGVKSVLVMELMQCDLMTAIKDRQDRNQPWTEAELVGYLGRIAAALHYAQQKHIAHRDLKPQNLLLTPNSIIKLADFGSSRQFPEQSKSIQGTPLFLSPEMRLLLLNRLANKPSEQFCDYYLSDVYSLGMTFLCAAMLRLPGEGVDRALGKMGKKRGLRDLLGAMLREEPEKRPSFAEIEAICGENQVNLAEIRPISQAATIISENCSLIRCCICYKPVSPFPLIPSPFQSYTPFACSLPCFSVLEAALTKSNGKCQCCNTNITATEAPIVITPCKHLFHSLSCFKSYLTDCGLDYKCPNCTVKIEEREIDRAVYAGFYMEIDLSKRLLCCSVCGKMRETVAYGRCERHKYCEDCRYSALYRLFQQGCWLCEKERVIS